MTHKKGEGQTSRSASEGPVWLLPSLCSWLCMMSSCSWGVMGRLYGAGAWLCVRPLQKCQIDKERQKSLFTCSYYIGCGSNLQGICAHIILHTLSCGYWVSFCFQSEKVMCYLRETLRTTTRIQIWLIGLMLFTFSFECEALEGYQRRQPSVLVLSAGGLRCAGCVHWGWSYWRWSLRVSGGAAAPWMGQPGSMSLPGAEGGAGCADSQSIGETHGST